MSAADYRVSAHRGNVGGNGLLLLPAGVRAMFVSMPMYAKYPEIAVMSTTPCSPNFFRARAYVASLTYLLT